MPVEFFLCGGVRSDAIRYPLTPVTGSGREIGDLNGAAKLQILFFWRRGKAGRRPAVPPSQRRPNAGKHGLF